VDTDDLGAQQALLEWLSTHEDAAQPPPKRAGKVRRFAHRASRVETS